MHADCECGTLHDHAGRRARCRECGTACCRSCALEIDAEIYCRWCAVLRASA